MEAIKRTKTKEIDVKYAQEVPLSYHSSQHLNSMECRVYVNPSNVYHFKESKNGGLNQGANLDLVITNLNQEERMGLGGDKSKPPTHTLRLRS